MISVAWPTLQHFSTLSHKRHDFRRKVTEHKICVSSFSTTFVWNIFHSKKNWARYDQKCILVFMWSTVYFYQILIKREFSGRIFEKYPRILNFMKIHPVGAELFHTYGRTYITKLMIAFRNFANALKIPWVHILMNCASHACGFLGTRFAIGNM
jgi:hypothetical protein